ncbi:MAG: dihydrolipoamide acetyltransferase family protein [Candidatus Izemoplasma sp.]|nr:dihydrolipoamide acetyltransferase family protein [Candidatus Izemoplasma sp.]
MNFKFADIGEGIHEGVILEWKYKVGDTIEEGETLVIVETDKVNAEIPSPVTGDIKTLGPDAGEEIHVGETLAIIDDGEGDDEDEAATVKDSDQKDDTSNDESSSESAEEEKGAGVVGSIEVSNDVIASSTEGEEEDEEIVNKRVLATPVARKLAKDLGVDIKTIKGSGKNGRVMKDDIYQAAEKNGPQSDKETSSKGSKRIQVDASLPNFDENRTRREKISKLRQTIADNMTTSKTVIPHTTVMDEVIVEALVQFREENKSLAKERDVHMTYMPFIIKALTKTLEEYPRFNSSFDYDKSEIIYKNYMNIGVAVDTPDGLIVPNIKDADKRGVFGLAKELSTLKEKANNKKIQLEDLRDGTISITNYGVFDSTFGAPVIKYPEVAILGIGRISEKPVAVDGEVVIKHVLPLSLSIDHRVIDGGDAGRFLRTFKSYLKNPMLLLLS